MVSSSSGGGRAPYKHSRTQASSNSRLTHHIHHPGTVSTLHAMKLSLTLLISLQGNLLDLQHLANRKKKRKHKDCAGDLGARRGSGVGHFTHVPFVQNNHRASLEERSLGNRPKRKGQHRFWWTPAVSHKRERIWILMCLKRWMLQIYQWNWSQASDFTYGRGSVAVDNVDIQDNKGGSGIGGHFCAM